VTHPPNLFRTFRLYLISLSVLGIVLVLINTSAYGPGISSDGMEYIAAADNLLRGKGFTNFHGGPYVLWPPLYPIILAGMGWLTGLDVIFAGWILNAITFGAIIYLTGILLEICFPETLTWPILGTFISFLSMSYLTLASNIASDSLFIVMFLLFSIACQRYLVHSSRGALALLFLLAMLAPLQRLLGACIVAVGALVVLVKHRDRTWKAIGGAILFGLASSLPILVWVIGRNYLQYGHLTGPRHFQDAYPLLNIAYHTRMILHWFIPLSVLNRLPLWLVPALALAALLLLGRRAHWMALFDRLRAPSHWPMLAFSILYLLILIPTTITMDHTHPYDDRFQAVIFAPVWILVFSLLQDLLIPVLQSRRLPFVQPAIALLIVLWSAYPISLLQKYMRQSIQEGEALYNEYNTRSFQESPVVRYLHENMLDTSLPVYSNDPEAAYLFSRQITHYSPRDLENNDRDDEYLLAHYRDWPEEGRIYLVWFATRADRREFFIPDDLREIADLEELFSAERSGGVYIVRSRHP